jgi:hypothetical protein
MLPEWYAMSLHYNHQSLKKLAAEQKLHRGMDTSSLSGKQIECKACMFHESWKKRIISSDKILLHICRLILQ